MGLSFPRALPVILVLLVLNVGCARLFPQLRPEPVAPPLPGTLFHADGSKLVFSELADLAASSDFLLIGESHANACDHRFQADTLDALAKAGLALTLGLEMIPWSAQPVLEGFHQGNVSLDDLEEQLDWREYWGFNFALYRPILERAGHWNIPVYGLNVPRDLLRTIREDGFESIPAEERGLLPPVLIPPLPQQRASIAAEYQRHVEIMPDRTAEAGFELERFTMIQSLWDTQMAFAATQFRGEHNPLMVILAGAGHVEFGHGIPHRLRLLNDNPEILTLLPWRGGPAPDPTAADLFYYCPKSPQRLGLLITWVEEQAHVTGVIPGSLGEAAGLAPGDILLAADGTPITSLEVLHLAGIRTKGEQRPLRLDVLRGKDQLSLTIPSP